MDNQLLIYIMIGAGVLFSVIVIAYMLLQKNNKEAKYIRQLQQGTKTSSFSLEVMYQ